MFFGQIFQILVYQNMKLIFLGDKIIYESIRPNIGRFLKFSASKMPLLGIFYFCTDNLRKWLKNIKIRRVPLKLPIKIHRFDAGIFPIAFFREFTIFYLFINQKRGILDLETHKLGGKLFNCSFYSLAYSYNIFYLGYFEQDSFF